MTKPGHYNVLALLPEDNTYAQLLSGRVTARSVATYMLMNAMSTSVSHDHQNRLFICTFEPNSDTVIMQFCKR